MSDERKGTMTKEEGAAYDREVFIPCQLRVLRRAERKTEQLDILTGIITILVIIFFGITLWLEIAGMPALTMALFLLALVIFWFCIWNLRVRTHRDAVRIRQRQAKME